MSADANDKTAALLRAIADANLDGSAANAAADLVDVLSQRVGSRIRVRDDLGYAARAVADRYAERARRAPVGAELRAAGYITLALDLEDGFDLTGLVERLERSPEREGRAACLASLRALVSEAGA